MEKVLQMKRVLRTALLVLLLGVVGMGKGYAYDFSAVCPTGQTLYYNITDAYNHYVELTFPAAHSFNPYYGFTKPTGDIILPGSVTYNGINYTVTAIGEHAFFACTDLTGGLTIPNSVTSIGYVAFYNCGFNGNLTIPNSVVTIGVRAFYNCIGFTGSLTIPNSVTSMGEAAFYNCHGFTGNLTISNSVTSIDKETFSHCSYLKGDLNIPNSVTSIGEEAFSNCWSFTGLTIPNSVTVIGSGAFSGCSFRGGLDINMTNISNDAFSGCRFSGDLTIGNSVKTIGQKAFYECWFSGSLTIPSSVTSIGEDAFRGCSCFGLEINMINIPNNAFRDCDGFDGILTIGNSVNTIGEYAFYGCRDFFGNLIIPNSVTSIGEFAFYNCSGFAGNLVIPNSVTHIGRGAFGLCSGFTGGLTISNSVTELLGTFSGCSGFTGNLTIPNSVTNIEGAFADCSGLTGELIIPSSVTNINGAFYGCSGFTGSLIIPNSVTTIGEGTFTGCSGFTGNLVIPNSVRTIESSPEDHRMGAFQGCSGLTSVTMNNVTLIGERAFRGCSNLISVAIPNSVTTIGENAFYGCTSLTSITIPNSVTFIGKNAFSGTGWYAAQPDGSILYLSNWCLGYKAPKPIGSLVLRGDTRGIVDEAFINCSDLTSVSIPNTVVTIGNNVFKNCSGLKEIYFDAKDCIYDVWSGCTEVTTVVLGDFVESIYGNMFSDLENLTTVTIGKSVRSIGSMAFANNPRLNMIYYNVEEDLSSATNVFNNCPNLTTIHIGPDVKEIGSNIFKGCNTVHFVVALGPTPAVLDAGAFSDIVDNSVLMVSCGNRVTYYSVWNMFPYNNIIEDCDSYGISVGTVGSGGSVTSSAPEAKLGDEVRLTVRPNPGMVLSSLKVCSASDPTQIVPISLVGKTSSTYKFTMPPFEVVAMATFKSSASISESCGIEVSVYPNPTNGYLRVEAESIKHISISNMLGQVIFDGKAEGDVFEYDFGRQKTGIYLIRIETASGMVVKKVSVAR